MQVVEQTAEGLSREFKVTVEASELDRRLTQKIEEVKDKVALKGFRPGKAPVSFLKKRFGREMMGEIVQDLLSETSEKTLRERDLKPAMQPKIDLEGDFETIAKGGVDLEYTLAVEVLPSFEPADLSGLKLERITADVTDEDVEARLKELAEMQKIYKPKSDKAKAKDGDQLTIDFTGSIEGEEFEGGKGEDVRLILGSGSFIPGFEEQLVGVKTGDEPVVKVTFPEDYPAEQLRGKEAEFKVEVKEVAGPEDAKIDDELAKKLGLDDLDALKKAVREQIEREYGEQTRMHLKRKLLDALDEKHDFEVPPGMVDAEFEQIWRQVEQAGLDDEDKEKPEEEVKAEYRKIATRRVRLGLVLAEIGQRNSIEVPQEALSRAIAEQARMMPGREQQVYKFYQENPSALAQLRAPLFEDRVVDFILELAEIEDKKVSKEELFSDPEGDDL